MLRPSCCFLVLALFPLLLVLLILIFFDCSRFLLRFVLFPLFLSGRGPGKLNKQFHEKKALSLVLALFLLRMRLSLDRKASLP